MFPMITDVEEVKQAKLILEKIKNELKDEKIPFNEEIKIGVMIEHIAEQALQIIEFIENIV